MILVLLDLSAAFDTVDHKLLLDRLENRLGITGNALLWFKSYLMDRKQRVQINGVCSKSTNLTCGVPQGSVLGPILFTVYTLPLGDILRKHGLSYHLYADDTQIYMSFNRLPGHCTESLEVAKSKLENCFSEIRIWMAMNYLKLNDDKTEILLISSYHREKVIFDNIKIGSAVIEPSEQARNIRVIFDSIMYMEPHINSLVSQAFYHVINISSIRTYLNRSAAIKSVHAFVSSKLDYCNSPLYGLPNTQTGKLQ